MEKRIPTTWNKLYSKKLLMVFTTRMPQNCCLCPWPSRLKNVNSFFFEKRILTILNKVFFGLLTPMWPLHFSFAGTTGLSTPASLNQRSREVKCKFIKLFWLLSKKLLTNHNLVIIFRFRKNVKICSLCSYASRLKERIKNEVFSFEGANTDNNK